MDEDTRTHIDRQLDVFYYLYLDRNLATPAPTGVWLDGHGVQNPMRLMSGDHLGQSIRRVESDLQRYTKSRPPRFVGNPDVLMVLLNPAKALIAELREHHAEKTRL